jgi:hypothetical protein
MKEKVQVRNLFGGVQDLEKLYPVTLHRTVKNKDEKYHSLTWYFSKICEAPAISGTMEAPGLYTHQTIS